MEILEGVLLEMSSPLDKNLWYWLSGKKVISSFLSGLNPKYDGEADTYKDALSNYITWKQQWLFAYQTSLVKKDPTKYKIADKFTPGTGFIPFNMSLTMDGLSGFIIGINWSIKKLVPSTGSCL